MEEHTVEIIAFPEHRNTAGNGDLILWVIGGRARPGKIGFGKRTLLQQIFGTAATIRDCSLRSMPPGW